MSTQPTIDALKLMRELIPLMEFWRRGSESSRLSAVDLEKVLKKNLAESYWPLVRQVLQEREAQAKANDSPPPRKVPGYY
jgi:hypothetical protein